jgi:hypothetical protein
MPEPMMPSPRIATFGFDIVLLIVSVIPGE